MAFTSHPGEAVIVSCGDASKYLIGTDAGKGTITYQRAVNGDLLFLDSLEAAKEALVEAGHKSATLIIDSPYDEMIGTETCDSSVLVIPL